MDYRIYQITNLVNQKKYIGQTIETLPKRWFKHLAVNSPCLKMARAIKKYGKANFIMELLETCYSQEEADTREIHWIAKLETVTQGYNICVGGRTGGTRGPHTEAAKRKISLANSGSNNGMYGKPAPNRGMPGTRLGMLKFSPEVIKDMQEFHQLGFSYSEIARQFGSERHAVKRYCQSTPLSAS